MPFPRYDYLSPTDSWPISIIGLAIQLIKMNYFPRRYRISIRFLVLSNLSEIYLIDYFNKVI